MDDQPSPDGHRVTLRERTEAAERARSHRTPSGRPSTRPECVVIGHFWAEDADRDGHLICVVCQVVRLP